MVEVRESHGDGLLSDLVVYCRANSDHITTNYQFICSSVVVIDFRHNILNYNYLWLKSQLLPITITQILRQ